MEEENKVAEEKVAGDVEETAAPEESAEVETEEAGSAVVTDETDELKEDAQ